MTISLKEKLMPPTNHKAEGKYSHYVMLSDNYFILFSNPEWQRGQKGHWLDPL